MPTDLTIFTAQHLVFIAGAIAVVILALRLWPQPRLAVVRWLVAAGLVLVLSYGLAQLGAMLYTDPRPFTTSGVPSLIAHVPDNGFPSDHALLAAALVALVALGWTGAGRCRWRCWRCWWIGRGWEQDCTIRLMWWAAPFVWR